MKEIGFTDPWAVQCTRCFLLRHHAPEDAARHQEPPRGPAGLPPGVQKGKVPDHIVKKNIGPAIDNQFADNAINIYYKKIS